MVIVGVDAHKRTHTLVAIDEAGRKLGERTVAAMSEGHLQALCRRTLKSGSPAIPILLANSADAQFWSV